MLLQLPIDSYVYLQAERKKDWKRQSSGSIVL